MTRNSGEVVVIEEAPSVPSAVDRREEPTAPKHVMPPPLPAGRKSTIELFNDDLAPLERPLEGDIEYFDEAQPPSRWRQVAGFFVVVVIVGAGGALLISRNRASADARELAAAQAPAAAAVVAAPPSPALAAEQKPPAPAAPEAPAAAADAPAADEAAADSAGDDSDRPAPSTRSAWTKVRTKAGHAKHARSGSSKTTTTHRTTKTKRTVIAKNTVSRRH